MSAYYPAVMAQVDFACSVLGFIKRLLRAVLPALARDRSILGTKEQFRAQIDAAFAALNPHEATERDYRLAVANAACAEVAKLCEILTGACMCLGFSDIAKRYLDARKFIALVLGQDKAQIDALFKLVREGDGNLGRLLMRVGAILEGRPDTYDDMDAAAKRKATVDTKKIIAEVKTIAADMSRKIDEGKAEIVEHVDAVGAKVDKLKFRKKRKSKYSDAVRDACLAYWNAEQKNVEVRHSLNTRVTYEAVFKRHLGELAAFGITTVVQLQKIVHAAQSRECEARKRKLDAQRDGRRKEVSQTPPKNGTMAGVKNTLKAAFALTLATIGVAAPCAASERAARISEPPPLASRGVAQTPPNAASDAIRAEVRGRVVKVADGDTLTVLDAANNQHKIRLNAIDAPEKDQAFGQKSKQRLSDYVFGKDVTVKWKSKDKYGRILGTVFVDGKDINLEMLKAGMAWHYKRFDKSPAYAAAEQDARENRRGLWIDPNPIPPEQFRHAVPSPSAAVPVGSRVPRDRIEYRAGNTLPVSARMPAPVNATWPDTGYWLSTNSNKRHNRNCENYRKTRGYPCQKNEGERCGKCGG